MEERVTWRRLLEVPGVELLYLENTDRHWKVINDTFGIGASTGWHGDLVYDGRRSTMTPGTSLCLVPGVVHSTPKTHRRGNFQSVTFTPSLFERYLADHEVPLGRAVWADPVASLSPGVLKRLDRVVGLAGAAHTAMEIQESILDLVGLAVSELFETKPRPKPTGRQKAEWIRECLHDTDSTNMSLDTLAEQTGMNRYEVVRTFTARYGIAPHAYQICGKIVLARKLLQEGQAAVDVAAACGFADQSHLGRHFRRLMGVTPGEYAKACNPRFASATAAARTPA